MTSKIAVEADAVKIELIRLHDRIRKLRNSCVGQVNFTLADANDELMKVIRLVDVACIDISYAEQEAGK
jgi:hypothetical protein